MRTMLRTYLAAVLALLYASVAVCRADDGRQKRVAFAWEVDFEMYFDNREYTEISPYPSKTIFGASLFPRIGVSIDSLHRIMAGAKVQKHFGGEFTDLLQRVSLYYEYGDGRHSVSAGVIPREKLAGNYSRAFFSDSTCFFNPTVQGVLYRYTSDIDGWDTSVEAAVDWMGRFSKTERERFMIFSAGEFSKGVFTLGYNAYMYHFSSCEEVEGVIDNFLLYPYAKADFGRWLHMDEFSLTAGWLQSLQNDRVRKTGYLFPGGAELGLRLMKWRVYVDNSVYLGGNLMPFYGDVDGRGRPYTDDLYFGDRFYSVDGGFYDRLEAGWEPRIASFLRLKLALVAHFYDGYCGFQQMLSLKVNF